MVLRTKFAVSNELTPSVFSSMVLDWISSSDTYSLRPSWDENREYELDSEDGSEHFRLYQDEDKFAFQLVKKTEDAELTILSVLRCFEDHSVLFFQQDKTLLKASKSETTGVEIPELLYRVFWEEYGGYDGDLMTDDKALVLRKQDVDQAVKLVNGQMQYLNPVVYISTDLHTGDYAVDYVKLAKQLLGMAHVVVEGSPAVAKMIQSSATGEMPKNGTIGVYYPTGEFEQISQEKTVVDSLTHTIVSDVKSAMAAVAPGDEFSFYKIRYNALRARLEDLSGDSELSELYDDILREKDAEISELNGKVGDLTRDLMCERAKAETLEKGFALKQGEEGPFCALHVTEKEFYDNEISDVILKVLFKEYQAIKDDKLIKNSRKAAVLKDILDHNKMTGTDLKIRKAFKGAIKEGTIHPENMTELERLGFEATLEGRRHYQLCYHGDPRYKMSVSTTPSDYRSGENMLSSYMNMLFGY